MAGFVKVAKTDEIVPGQGEIIEVGDKKIALFNVEGSFYAIVYHTCTDIAVGRFQKGCLKVNR